jgi:hypothetical protein
MDSVHSKSLESPPLIFQGSAEAGQDHGCHLEQLVENTVSLLFLNAQKMTIHHKLQGGGCVPLMASEVIESVL